MIFHSLDFACFFVVTVALYWALPHRWQNLLLLVASYAFYGWVHPWFLALIFATTFVDYWSAVGIERWPAHRRRFLWLSIASNLGLLGFFKYFGFFVDNVARPPRRSSAGRCRARCSTSSCRSGSRSTRSSR